MPDLLFVCNANRFRSVIAAESFRSLLKTYQTPGEWVVSSAGTRGIDGEHPLKAATNFCTSNGMSIEGFHAREINQNMVTEADLIIVMTADQKEAIECDFPQARGKTIQLTEICIDQVYDIPDPIISKDDDPQMIATEIYGLVKDGFNNILIKLDASLSG